MEFNAKRIRKKVDQFVKTNSKCFLQLYTIPPTDIISLDEFDKFGIERLHLLRAIERINLNGLPKFSEEWKSALYADLKKQKLKNYVEPPINSNEFDEIWRRDLISHFILRLAYCRTEDLRKWFISQEVDLFKAKYLNESKENIKQFFKLIKLNHSIVSLEEKKLKLEFLRNSSPGLSASKVLEYDYYKVPFTEALDLVRIRKVYLEKGLAYVPSCDFLPIVAAIFRQNLSQALVRTSRALPHLEEDERLTKLLMDFDKKYTGKDYSVATSDDVVTADMLESLSKQSFPLCMRQLHEKLRKEHHLKHHGRLQYGLFLKGIGVPLDEALKFWRTEFLKVIDMDKFDKMYSYNIRHSYGKEGKRVNYTPYSCLKIIMGSVGPGEHHGCPFKHSDINILRMKLLEYKVSQSGIEEIVGLVKAGHFQVACQKYFSYTHNAVLETLNHPNQYYEESQNALKNTSAAPTRKSEVKSNTTVIYPKPDECEVEWEDMDITSLPEDP